MAPWDRLPPVIREAVRRARELAVGVDARHHYAAENALLATKARPRAVFFGDSLVSHWNTTDVLPGFECVNRGISGQTTRQMRLRFETDVLDLAPDLVVIFGGTNDRMLGRDEQEVEANLEAMREAAQRHGARVVLCTELAPLLAEHYDDGVHPNADGYAVLAHALHHAISTPGRTS